MNIIDGDTSVEGRLYVLAGDGIYVRDKANSIHEQHLRPEQRQEYEWRRIEPPEGVRVTRVIAGAQSELFAIGDGKFYRRVRDYGYLAGEKFKWDEVEIS